MQNEKNKLVISEAKHKLNYLPDNLRGFVGGKVNKEDNMGLDAKDKTVYNLLNDKLFIIPINQRQYVWNQDNWADLFEDIDLMLEKKIENHFIGSIVLKRENIQDGIKEHFTIIDGQQRILTITILICSIAYLYAELNDQSRFEGLKKLLYVKNDKNESFPMISKKANNSIETLVNSLYDNVKVKSDKQIPFTTIEEFLQNIKISKEIKEPFLFFYYKLNESIKGNILKLEKYKKAIEDIRYINVEATESEDAFLIFEILNARGKPLTDFELLRNYFLKYASSDDKTQVKNRIENIENLLTTSTELFLKHYVTHKYGKKPNNSESRPYKLIVKNEKNSDKLELLSDLELKANYYNKIINLQNCTGLEKKIFSFFKPRRQQQFRPLILGLMHQKDLLNISVQKYNEAIIYLYSFFICYNIIGEQTSNKIEDIVYGYSEKFENEFSLEVLSKFKISMIERMPSEVQFKQTIKNLKYSHARKAYSSSRKADNIRAIFEILEKDIGCEEDLSSDNTNIEHCYPDSASEDNDVIGNLMLLEKHIEEKCKNKSIEYKKNLYQQSKLELPKLLVEEIGEKNSFDIQKRTDKLADTLYEIIYKLSIEPNEEA